MAKKDDYGIEQISFESKKEDPLADIADVEPNASNKSSLMGKVSGKVSELKQRYSSYQSMQKERAKEKAMKEIARAKEDREIRLLEKQAAKENVLNKQLKEETNAYRKQAGGGNPLAAMGQGLRAYSASRKTALYGNESKSKSSLLSGGLGGGSGLLGKGLGGKSSLLSGGMGSGSRLLSGGVGGKSRLLSGGLGKSGKMSLTLGKGKGLKL
jgi:hypothetical protein